MKLFLKILLFILTVFTTVGKVYSSTAKDGTCNNIMTAVSMQQQNGTFLNYYQNIAFRSDQPLNAMQHILENGLSPQYMGAKSGLWEPAKSALMPALMRKGQEDFLNHPATQIVSIFTSLSGAVEGVVSIAAGIRSLLTAAKGIAVAAKGGIQTTTRFVTNANGVITDLQPTLNRIATGGKFPHGNDGSIFKNAEGLLPKQNIGYYREFVHPTPGVKGPGAMRIVTGQNGQMWFTSDHYKTFISIR